MEVVAVHVTIALSARLLKVPLIGFALVLLITVKTMPKGSVPEIFGGNANLAPLIVTLLAITLSRCDPVGVTKESVELLGPTLAERTSG